MGGQPKTLIVTSIVYGFHFHSLLSFHSFHFASLLESESGFHTHSHHLLDTYFEVHDVMTASFSGNRSLSSLETENSTRTPSG